MRSGIAIAAVGAVLGCRRLLVEVRAGGHPRAGETSSRPWRLPGLWAYYCLQSCRGGFTWLLTRQVTRSASCLKEREGTAEPEECSAMPLPLMGLGWWPADGQSLQERYRDRTGPMARLIMPAAVCQSREAYLPRNDQPWLTTTP